MPLREEDIIATAKELRGQTRHRAGLKLDWDRASVEMKAWYIMLAKRAEGIEETLQ